MIDFLNFLSSGFISSNTYYNPIKIQNIGKKIKDYTTMLCNKQNELFPNLPITNFELMFLVSYCVLIIVVVFQAAKYSQELNSTNSRENNNDDDTNNNYLGLQIQIFDRRRNIDFIRNNINPMNYAGNQGIGRYGGYLPYDENSPVAKWRASLRNRSTLYGRRDSGDG